MRKSLIAILYTILIWRTSASVVDNYTKAVEELSRSVHLKNEYMIVLNKVRNICESGRMTGPDLDAYRIRLKELSATFGGLYASVDAGSKVGVDFLRARPMLLQDIQTLSVHITSVRQTCEQLSTSITEELSRLSTETNRRCVSNFEQLVGVVRQMGNHLDFGAVTEYDSYFFPLLMRLVQERSVITNSDIGEIQAALSKSSHLYGCTHAYTVLVRDLRFVWDRFVKDADEQASKVDTKIENLRHILTRYSCA